MNHILKTIRHAPPQLLARYLQLRAKRRVQGNKKLWSTLKKYLEQSPSTGCNYTDYDALYRYVRKARPREILECGTGASTVVLAHAIMENERDGWIRGRVTSLEELPEYYEAAKNILPSALKKYIDLRLSPAVEDYHEFFRGMRYQDVPDRPYDFVFTDGPSYIAADGSTTFDFDYIHVVKRSQIPVSGIIDQRVSTGYVFNAVFGEKKFRYDYVRKIGFVGPCTRADVGDTKMILARATTHHALRRPSFRQFLASF